MLKLFKKKLRPLPTLLGLCILLLSQKIVYMGEYLFGSSLPTAGDVEAATSPTPGHADEKKPEKKDAPTEKAPSFPPKKEETTPPSYRDSTPEKDTPATAPDAPPSFDLLNLNATEVELLQSLAKRRHDIEKQASDAAAEHKAVQLAQAQLKKLIEDLKAARTDLEVTLKAYEGKEKEKIQKSVKIYENMKPKEAARILETIEIDGLLAIISNMKEAKASDVLAAMATEKAKEITAKLMDKRASKESEKKP